MVIYAPDALSYWWAPNPAVELRWSDFLRHSGPLQLQSLAIYVLLARLGGKSSIFTHQNSSHSGRPQTAVELRATHYLRHSGPLQLQSLAIYMLLARLGGKRLGFLRTRCPLIVVGPKLPSSCGGPIICGILDHFSSKASLCTGFWLGWVGKARFCTHRMLLHADRQFNESLLLKVCAETSWHKMAQRSSRVLIQLCMNMGFAPPIILSSLAAFRDWSVFFLMKLSTY